ncbi:MULTISPECIES: cytochrome c biogenesis heme-transporting ATPase CcmA [Corallincola]|uniref:Cytochrome c biogenesis heme-transporting ATPase CcmA n=3 Tax=Corallincola TaxID=1775176 RepID=A0A368N3A5_9GAMM|nr:MULTISPECIES: cytochrome c biogenesis heme-transporting ATPase CcmA [Corallincola]RCU44543.1 cytochrome c biogenesis heme-transporting ATPase CcmA [Corallincola holothuriorum]TAA40288.1 cytochrome c biogenesis heme-transporting ATPase CcmA [Corallincola spongiicola]TCI05405.1 cytochrome c biogenesis heme-transporting ATPase CcmA [Corallincola luteus]
MLEATGLCCIRDDRLLFQSLDLAVGSGELLQIEGPNGAGKTSLLRILAALSQPQQGRILFNGEAIDSDREGYFSQLLYLGHKAGIKQEMTPLENLEFYQQVAPAKVDASLWQMLALVGLAGYEDMPAGKLSAGQQRRIALARLWLSSAKLWILDEPFTSLDKQGVAGLQQHFAAHLQQGGAIIMTSHQELHMPTVPVRRLMLGSSVEDVAGAGTGSEPAPQQVLVSGGVQ